jgi:hypothetical protein
MLAHLGYDYLITHIPLKIRAPVVEGFPSTLFGQTSDPQRVHDTIVHSWLVAYEKEMLDFLTWGGIYLQGHQYRIQEACVEPPD